MGKVIGISLDPKTRGHVLVRIAVDDLAPISASTYATLGYQGVTGLAFIQLDDEAIQGATAPQTRLSNNSRIPLKPGLMSQLSDQGERILGQLDQASQRLNELLSSQNQQTLMTTVDHLGKAALAIEQLSAQTRTLLPEMAKGARDSLATSLQVGESADAARMSAHAFQQVTERMFAPGGTLDQLGQATEVWVATNQTLQGITLPNLNRAAQHPPDRRPGANPARYAAGYAAGCASARARPGRARVFRAMNSECMDRHAALSMNTPAGLVVGSTSVDHGGLKSAPQGSWSVCGVGPIRQARDDGLRTVCAVGLDTAGWQ